MTNFRKKPTIREVANVTFELHQRITGIMNLLSELEKAFSLYVEMKKDTKKFSKFIDIKVKELMELDNDAKRNEESNRKDIPANSEDKKSGTEWIRKEEW